MSETDLATIDGEYREIAPTQTVEAFETKLGELRDFTKRNMRNGVDFGIIPGTPKPTLFKPGAEKLLRWHGLVVDTKMSGQLEVTGSVLDVDMAGSVRHASSGMVLGTVHANCNSEERRYKNARQKGQQTLADQKNTIIKMADKRAWVAAALLYTMASEAYTQDIEDTAGVAPEGSTASAQATGNCPKCGKPLRLRSGARGEFLGCSGYPNCKHTAQVAQSTPEAAPEPPPEKEAGGAARDAPTDAGEDAGVPPDEPYDSHPTTGEVVGDTVAQMSDEDVRTSLMGSQEPGGEPGALKERFGADAVVYKAWVTTVLGKPPSGKFTKPQCRKLLEAIWMEKQEAGKAG